MPVLVVLLALVTLVGVPVWIVHMVTEAWSAPQGKGDGPCS